MTQITITEANYHEGETFNYVLNVTDKEYEVIKEKLEKSDDYTFSLKETNYTDVEITDKNTRSYNTYMDYIGAYMVSGDDLEKMKEFNDVFYKGKGLTRLDSL